eukprot:PhF_6_TR16962/c0_g5_i2/m.25598
MPKSPSIYQRVLLFTNPERNMKSSVLRRKFAGIIQLLILITCVPFFYVAIWMDRVVFRRWNPFLSFPRNSNEILQNPKKFFRFVFREKIAKEGWQYLGFEATGGSDTEPEKNEMVLRCVFAYCVKNGPRQEIPLFVKMPTARMAPLGIKAVLATFTIEPKECLFYDVIVPELNKDTPFPVNVPRSICTAYSRVFDRTLVVAECIDLSQYEPMADWQITPESLPRVRAMHQKAARFHSASWGVNMKKKCLDWIPEQKSVGWIHGGMKMYLKDKSHSWAIVWYAIYDRLRDDDIPMCLSHGDFRPGNMLFHKSDVNNLFVCDWEAFSVTPYLWDISYSLFALDPETRKANSEVMIREYLDSLPLPHPTFGPDVLFLHKTLLIVVAYFGWLLFLIGNVGDTQGNSKQDMGVWEKNMRSAVSEIFEDIDGLASWLRVPKSHLEVVRDLLNGTKKN